MSLRVLALLLAALLLCVGVASAEDVCLGITDRDVLERLYFATGGPSWVGGSGWMTDADHCNWQGVYCTEYGSVMGLWMGDFGMSGRLPAEIGCLPSMEFLSFENNNLVTAFIPEMCQNTNLHHINMNNAEVVGPLPECIGYMPNLLTLHLSNNYLNAPLPESLGNAGSPLESFRANCSYLQGDLPLGLTDGTVTDVQVRCNDALTCPDTSSFLLCSLAGCDSECFDRDTQGCQPVTTVTGCGPYYLEVTPCEYFGIAGSVYDTSDPITPLEGVLVTGYPPWDLTPLESTLSNADGTYSLDLTGYAGDFSYIRVEFEKEWHVGVTETVPVPMCGEAELDASLMSLHCDSTLCVTVLNDCEEAIPDATVSVMVSTDTGIETETVVTDDTGVACFEVADIIPPFYVTVSACADEYAPLTVVFPLNCGDNTATLYLECTDSPTLAVDVYTAEPFAGVASGATVTWTAVDGDYTGSEVTDLSGEALFSDLPAEVLGRTVTLSVAGVEGYPEYSDGMAYTVPCCGPAVVTQTLPCPLQSLCISVSEGCGEAEVASIGGQTVTVSDMYGAVLGTVLTDSVGATCLNILPDTVSTPITDVVVSLTYDGEEYSQSVYMGCGETHTCIEVDCIRLVSVTVTNEIDVPLSNVEVSIYPVPSEDMAEGVDLSTDEWGEVVPVVTTYTDDAGRVGVDGLPAGTYHLSATPDHTSVYDGVYGIEFTLDMCEIEYVEVILPCKVPASLSATFLNVFGTLVDGVEVHTMINGVSYEGISENGVYNETNMNIGDAVLVYSHPLYQHRARAGDHVCGPNTLSVDLVCKVKRSLTVNLVIDKPFCNCGPIVDAKIMWEDLEGNTAIAFTDSTGVASFEELPDPDTHYTVSVVHVPGMYGDYAMLPFTDMQTLGPCEQRELDFQLDCYKQMVCVHVSGPAKDVEIEFYDASSNALDPLGSMMSPLSRKGHACFELYPLIKETIIDTGSGGGDGLGGGDGDGSGGQGSGCGCGSDTDTSETVPAGTPDIGLQGATSDTECECEEECVPPAPGTLIEYVTMKYTVNEVDYETTVSLLCGVNHVTLHAAGHRRSQSTMLRRMHFIDAPVHGLRVRTFARDTLEESSQQTTDESGSVYYASGEAGDFYLGDTLLGTAVLDHQVTPYDLFATSDSEDHRVANVASLLQSLDTTRDLGMITLSEEIIAHFNAAVEIVIAQRDLPLDGDEEDPVIDMTAKGETPIFLQGDDHTIPDTDGLRLSDDEEVEAVIDITLASYNADKVDDEQITKVNKQDAKGNLDAHVSKVMFRKNVSKTASEASAKAKMNLMDIWVDTQKANFKFDTLAADGVTIIEGSDASERGFPISYYRDVVTQEPVTTTDDSGNTVTELVDVYDTEMIGTTTKAKPIVICYADADPDTGAHDVYCAVSMDDGETFKRTNISRSGDQSSIDANGEPFYGHVTKPVFQVRGNKVLVGWVSKYAKGGSPTYSIPETIDVVRTKTTDGEALYTVPTDGKYCVVSGMGNDGSIPVGSVITTLTTTSSTADGDTTTETVLEDPPAEHTDEYSYSAKCMYYEKDIFGVGGPQKLVDYAEEGYPEVGEVPFNAVWVCRGIIPVATDLQGKGCFAKAKSALGLHENQIIWGKPERVTSGNRDAMQLFLGAAKGGGFAIAWQEDPEGTRTGKALGPGDGWTGATTNHKTDIWYSYITWGNLNKPDIYYMQNHDSGNELSGETGNSDGDATDGTQGGGSGTETDTDALSTTPMYSNRMRWLVPMSSPVRVSDNEVLNTTNLQVKLLEEDPDADPDAEPAYIAGLPELDANGKWIPLTSKDSGAGGDNGTTTGTGNSTDEDWTGPTQENNTDDDDDKEKTVGKHQYGYTLPEWALKRNRALQIMADNDEAPPFMEYYRTPCHVGEQTEHYVTGGVTDVVRDDDGYVLSYDVSQVEPDARWSRFTNQKGDEKMVCISDDGRILAGDKGASRPNLFLQTYVYYDEGDVKRTGAWAILAYEETKGMGAGPPEGTSEGGSQGDTDSGNSGDGPAQDGSGDGTGSPHPEPEEVGKNIIYHSFDFRYPPIVSGGHQMNVPETVLIKPDEDDTSTYYYEPLYLGETREDDEGNRTNTGLMLPDALGRGQVLHENSRRPRFIMQGVGLVLPSKCQTPLVMLSKQGRDGQGRPSDIMAQRISLLEKNHPELEGTGTMPFLWDKETFFDSDVKHNSCKKGWNPYAAQYFTCPETTRVKGINPNRLNQTAQPGDADYLPTVFDVDVESSLVDAFTYRTVIDPIMTVGSDGYVTLSPGSEEREVTRCYNPYIEPQNRKQWVFDESKVEVDGDTVVDDGWSYGEITRLTSQNISSVTVLAEKPAGGGSSDSDSSSDSDEEDDNVPKGEDKTLLFTQREANLFDTSYADPRPDARAHRGAIRGDFILAGFSHTPNWGAIRNGNDKYDFYVRRSWDGGASWTTMPVGANYKGKPVPGPGKRPLNQHVDLFKDILSTPTEERRFLDGTDTRDHSAPDSTTVTLNGAIITKEAIEELYANIEGADSVMVYETATSSGSGNDSTSQKDPDSVVADADSDVGGTMIKVVHSYQPDPKKYPHGVFEPAKNISLLQNAKESVIEPRIVGTPGTIKDPETGTWKVKEDKQNPFHIYLAFGTSHNGKPVEVETDEIDEETGMNKTVEERDTAPEDLYFTWTKDFGNTYYSYVHPQNTSSDSKGQNSSLNENEQVIDQNELDQAKPKNEDDGSPGSVAEWLQKGAGYESGEVQIRMTPGGNVLYAAWLEEGENESDIMLRRFITDQFEVPDFTSDE
ncbi:hypothetical protein KIPB_000941 [Kipferlia bialata]|uniref:Uncharacterized protein n=1 Tax=Kipferlia bialata TaxID=797122 RepID=A0A9K3CQ12_9EUKA|nr:hypothetical protein KIPB_000941 [Kipferlia bialata]|eukprot:g941.t1